MDETLRQLLNIGKEYYLKRDFPNARAYLEQVIERSQGFADVYNMLGVIYHDVGLFSKAQGALETALRLNPAYTEAALNLAVLYNDLGKYGEARATYDQALHYCRAEPGELDPFIAGKIANMHADIADAYRSAGKLREAIGEYKKAVDLRPTFADIRTRLAAVILELGQHAAAAKELQRALADRPHYLPARVLLGLCCYSMGRADDAIKQWGLVLEQDPGHLNAAMYIRMVQAGSHAPDAASNA